MLPPAQTRKTFEHRCAHERNKMSYLNIGAHHSIRVHTPLCLHTTARTDSITVEIDNTNNRANRLSSSAQPFSPEADFDVYKYMGAVPFKRHCTMFVLLDEICRVFGVAKTTHFVGREERLHERSKKYIHYNNFQQVLDIL